MTIKELPLQSSYEDSYLGLNAERAFFVDQIPAGTDQLVAAAAKFAPGIPQKGDSHPENAFSVVRRVKVALLSDTQATVFIGYEPLGELDGRWIMEDDFAISSVQTQIHPLTNEPMKVRWKDTKSNKVKQDTATVTWNVPMRAIRATGLLSPERKEAVAQYVGYVNQIAWKGLNKAFWLYAGLRTIRRANAGPYQAEAYFISKNFEDWSTYSIYQFDGRLIDLDQAQVQEARSAAYIADWFIYSGFTKVGLYPLTDFNNLFPFDGPTTVSGPGGILGPT